MSDPQSGDMRRCYRCKEVKALTAFHRAAERSKGYAHRCKQCDRDKQQRRNCTEQRRAQHRVNSQRWIARNPGKVKAHMAVAAAIASGQLVRPSKCQACESEKPLAGHHSDYAKPLVVEWLCVECHEKKHHVAA